MSFAIVGSLTLRIVPLTHFGLLFLVCLCDRYICDKGPFQNVPFNFRTWVVLLHRNKQTKLLCFFRNLIAGDSWGTRVFSSFFFSSRQLLYCCLWISTDRRCRSMRPSFSDFHERQSESRTGLIWSNSRQTTRLNTQDKNRTLNVWNKADISAVLISNEISTPPFARRSLKRSQQFQVLKSIFWFMGC